MFYKWFVFLHIIGVFGFLIAHGASASVAFALRKERKVERIRALLLLSAGSYPLMYLSLLILLISGIITGFTGHWWGRGWIWVSLILLVAIIVAMVPLGSNIYGAARKASGLPYFEKGKTQEPVEPKNEEEIGKILDKGNPWLLSTIGFGGIAVITYLMILKPF